MIRLRIKNYNMVLTKKQQKYWDYHNIDKYEHFTGEEKLSLPQSQIFEQAKFTFFFWKNFE